MGNGHGAASFRGEGSIPRSGPHLHSYQSAQQVVFTAEPQDLQTCGWPTRIEERGVEAWPSINAQAHTHTLPQADRQTTGEKFTLTSTLQSGLLLLKLFGPELCYFPVFHCPHSQSPYLLTKPLWILSRKASTTECANSKDNLHRAAPCRWQRFKIIRAAIRRVIYAIHALRYQRLQLVALNDLCSILDVQSTPLL